MKNLGCLAMLALLFIACNKEDTATKIDQYHDILYKIQSGDSNLLLTFQRAVYDNTQKGNIDVDTTLVAPGSYVIKATVLTGMQVRMTGQSFKSGNFSLMVTSDNGTVLAKTDTITHTPANQLQPEYWFARIFATP